MSAEDALAKAKAIAARLSGSGSNDFENNSANATPSPATVNALDVAKAAEAALAGISNAAAAVATTTKRKRWDDPQQQQDDLAKKLKGDDEPDAAAVAASRRVWISTKAKPGGHFRLYWEEHAASIANQISSGDVHLELKGRGSSATAALPGIPEEPLHLLIRAPSMERVEAAEPLVEQLFVMKAENMEETLEDDSTNASSQQQVIAADPTKGYRPAPVASLIHNVNNGGGMDDGGEMLEEKIGVPNGLVGFIIGRGGESISSMQARTGAKVQIQREAEMAPGATQREITICSVTVEAIAACRAIIERMVQDRTNSTNQAQQRYSNNNNGPGSSSQEVRLQQAVEAGHALLKVAVPNTDVGLIIGKAGTTIKSIQDRSGANIQIPQSGDIDNPSIRTVSITHPHGEGAQLAKQMIQDILGSKRNQVPHVTIQVDIPDKDVGMCIGRCGCVIREMQNQTGTKIQIPSVSTPGQPSRIATVFGPSDGCDHVKQMIERIVLEQSSQSVMSGQQQQQLDAYGQFNPQQQQQQQQVPNNMYGQQQQHHQQQQQQQQGVYGYQQQHHQQQQQQQYQQQPQTQHNAYSVGQQVGQQQQQQQQAQDYSKEWAAYYAAQNTAAAQTAAVQTAVAQTAVAVQNATQINTVETAAASNMHSVVASSQGTAVATGQETADTYHEQFHRYAYYYGEEAARKYYGAWSPQQGTPNPYGTNPNGITAPPQSQAPAPAAAAATAISAANNIAASVAAATNVAALAPVAAPRDSGRRGVSNLPAWMTAKQG
eukprot:CAMPEP_0194160566 /NCGR_PEP_ID=MMETSP0152-20130528/78458_1 /TAXON_ID=1049557 /ORGANISM="Thalassiothrix antarctica, Strain L6-D1" /LENGTH=773 /DNA_ID=CAMNT_0038870265 /DNA_START=50 /DNA_END=2371 /DNA_ORIENTATION=+